MGVHVIRHEFGAILPSRVAVHATARELLDLAARAVEFSGTGPTADLHLALRQLDAMRAVLGVASSSAAIGQREASSSAAIGQREASSSAAIGQREASSSGPQRAEGQPIGRKDSSDG